MTDFYVYIHRKATDGEIFYVGKGQGNRAKAINPTQETRDRMSEAQKGKKRSMESIAKASRSNMGRKPTEETLEKLRKPKSAEHRKNISLGRKGIVFTEEHKKALRIATIAFNQNNKAVVL